VDTVAKSDCERPRDHANGEWLNDKVVDAINNIHLDTSDSETSLVAQGAGKFRSVNRDMQVMYSNDHWIATCDDSEVLVANMSWKHHIANCKQAIMKQLYRRRSDANGQLRRLCSSLCVEWASSSTN